MEIALLFFLFEMDSVHQKTFRQYRRVYQRKEKPLTILSLTITAVIHILVYVLSNFFLLTFMYMFYFEVNVKLCHVYCFIIFSSIYFFEHLNLL